MRTEALQRSSSEKLFKEALQRISSPRNKRRVPSLLCMAVRLRGGVVIPTRLSMHVAMSSTDQQPHTIRTLTAHSPLRSRHCARYDTCASGTAPLSSQQCGVPERHALLLRQSLFCHFRDQSRLQVVQAATVERIYARCVVWQGACVIHVGAAD